MSDTANSVSPPTFHSTVPDHSHAGETDEDRAERMEDEGAAMAPIKLTGDDGAGDR